jgi:hydroxypyruvate isomerase
MPVPDFVRLVAETGFAAVEIWGRDPGFPELAALAHDHGLVLATMIGHYSLDAGMNDPAQHDRIEAELRESIDLAAKYGVPGLICFSGARRAGQSEAGAIAACVQGFRRIAPYAEDKGVNLNLELLNSRVDHAGYQCDHTAWGLAVCQEVNSPRVKLLYDIYHMQIMEGDVIRTIQSAIPWIGHFHTAGVPGRFDIDDSQELNYAAVCRAIAATPYNLYIGHEFMPRGDLATALRTAFKICNQGAP